MKQQFPEQRYLAVGVGSVQHNEKHVIFLDLDGHSREQAESVARELINKIGVSDCYIVKSSQGNHHLLTFDIVDFKIAEKVAKLFGHAKWAKYRSMNEDYVLRVSAKLELKDREIHPVKETIPELVSVVKSPFSYYEKSNSLRKIFKNLWNHPIPKDMMFNDDNCFRTHLYQTRVLNG